MDADTSFIKFAGVRGMIARNMMGSLHGGAQLTYTTDVDVSALIAARAACKAAGSAISYEDMMLKVVSTALLNHPAHNGTVDETGATLSAAIHMAFAVASPTGLMVPVVRDVQAKTLVEIADARRDLVNKAQAGKLEIKDMKGGTFTLSNLGQTRVDHFTPILNAGQIALLGVGRIRQYPSGTGTPLMGLSLTADHRVVDGWASGQFLTEIAERLESFSVDGA
ncbi:2-oxo acid dehydrogenase subunit E2 [Kordiimonas pumila]|uniref:2-oxo acid dehydrogenase subunit E2 n=1 Tax=Kordiimonas pumila TaxID=2161677 RepID=A0ABV7D8V2_9PROT|nr:2-oxo acid dehydrogenase subunit E2 [Kordiimonas pumila]